MWLSTIDFNQMLLESMILTDYANQSSQFFFFFFFSSDHFSKECEENEEKSHQFTNISKVCPSNLEVPVVHCKKQAGRNRYEVLIWCRTHLLCCVLLLCICMHAIQIHKLFPTEQL